MFERFTDRARRVLVLAQEEARLLNHNFIGTEHILLGLIHEGEGVAAQALGALGVNLARVREKVKESVGPSAVATTGSPPFTPRAKKVLELSLREALQLGHDYIGTEHILLGLVREGEGVAAQVLAVLGVELDVVRQHVIQLLSGDRPPDTAAGPHVSIAARRDGPRCSRCQSLLQSQVVYRVLRVPPAADSTASEPIDVVFVYCWSCGTVITQMAAEQTIERLLSRRPTRWRLPRFRPGRREPPATAIATLHPFDSRSPWRSTPDESRRDRTVAEGSTAEGVRWTLTAGGSDESYSTVLRTEDGAGVIDSGGMGGPKLWGEDRLNVYTGGNPDRGPRGVVVRCDPSIVRLMLVAESGTEIDLTQGDDEVDGLRFGVALVDPYARLREVVGFDRDGSVIERFDLRGHDSSWRENR